MRDGATAPGERHGVVRPVQREAVREGAHQLVPPLVHPLRDGSHAEPQAVQVPRPPEEGLRADEPWQALERDDVEDVAAEVEVLKHQQAEAVDGAGEPARAPGFGAERRLQHLLGHAELQALEAVQGGCPGGGGTGTGTGTGTGRAPAAVAAEWGSLGGAV